MAIKSCRHLESLHNFSSTYRPERHTKYCGGGAFRDAGEWTDATAVFTAMSFVTRARSGRSFHAVCKQCLPRDGVAACTSRSRDCQCAAPYLQCCAS